MKFLSSAIKYCLLLLCVSSCHRGMVCPAFQSSFILDDSVRLVTFSMFGPDSLPKQFMVDKGKYGIIEPVSHGKKYNSIKSIQMVTIFPPGLPGGDSTQVVPQDSLQMPLSDLK